MWARTFDSVERVIQEGRVGFSRQTIAPVAEEGAPLYAECLGRIISSDGVVLAVDELFETPGAIENVAAFDRHMLILALEWLTLHPAGNLGYGVSTSTLSSPRNRQAVLDILIAMQGMAGRLVLELKSGGAGFDIASIRDFCQTVRRLGYRVALSSRELASLKSASRGSSRPRVSGRGDDIVEIGLSRAGWAPRAFLH